MKAGRLSAWNTLWPSDSVGQEAYCCKRVAAWPLASLLQQLQQLLPAGPPPAVDARSLDFSRLVVWRKKKFKIVARATTIVARAATRPK